MKVHPCPFDFDNGIVRYQTFDYDPTLERGIADGELTEDLIQVEYPKDLLIDIGWYGPNPNSYAAKKHKRMGRYLVLIVRQHEWQHVVWKKEAHTFDELRVVVKEAVEKMKTLLV